MGKLLVGVLSGGVILGTILACSATEDGERARTGECPVETCVEGFAGLRFTVLGFELMESPTLLPIAVGGTTTIGMQPIEGAFPASPLYGISGSIEIEGPGTDEYFDAERSLDLRATSEGTAVLDVTNERGALYDRVTLSTRTVDRIEVVVRDREDEPAYLDANTATDVAVRLFDASGTRLQDTSLEVRATDGEADRVWWDIVQLFPATGTSTVTLDIAAGDTRSRVVLPVR